MSFRYSLEPANFDDYRDFLKRRFEDLKKKNPRFSLQVCAGKSGLSRSLLQFLFKKTRHVSLDSLPGLSKALKLTEDEEYFTYLLVCKNSSKSPRIQDHFERILSRLRHHEVTVDTEAPVPSPGDHKAYFNDASMMLLLGVARLEGFQEDPAWIQKHLLIPDLGADEIRAGLRALERMGLLSRDPAGALKAVDEVFWRPDPFDPSGNSVYQRAAASVAKYLERANVYKPAVFMSMALGFDEENLLKAEKAMIELHHQLNALAKASPRKTALVYSGNFFLTMARLR